MVKSKWTSAVVVAAVAVFLFSGCQFLNPASGAGDSLANGGSSAVTVRTVISEMGTSLKTDAQFSTVQINAVTTKAQDAVDKAAVDQSVLETAMPYALAGAETGLSSALFTDAQRVTGVQVIVASFVTSLNGRFDATSRSIQNRRALTLSASVISDLLARLSRAAISNLANTGISSANLGSTAGKVVGNMIASLDNGGVNKSLVSEALVQITQNAVASLRDAGVGDAAMAVAVQAVTKGAVAAVASIKVDGVTSDDLPSLTNQITQGAASSLESVVSTAVDMKTLAASVASGATDGITQASTVWEADSGTALSSTVLKAMVQNATQGTTVGVMQNASVSAAADATGLIGAVTAAASTQLEVNKVKLNLNTSEIQTSVAIGASAAAQSTLSGALTSDDLQAAIVLKDSAGNPATVDAAALASAITSGIAQATNTPPVAAFADLAVVVHSQATLDGTGSTDNQAEPLEYLWTLVQKPKGSSASISGATLSKATLVPDLAGSYIVSLKVTDLQGGSDEVFGVVTATADNSNISYGGKTATDRLTNAKALLKTGDYPEARDELLTLLGHYPDSSLFDEAILRLGQAYQGLGSTDLAAQRFKEAYLRTNPMTDANKVIGAQIRLIWADTVMNQTGQNSVLAALISTMSDEVIAQRAGTTDEGEAYRMKANLLDSTGKHAEAITALKNLLTFPASTLSPESRYWVAFGIGWAYNNLGDGVQAEAAFKASHDYLAPVSPDSRWTLSLQKYCDAMWPWWWNGNGYTHANQGISAMVAGASDKTISADYRMEMARIAAEFYIWNNGNTVATYQKGIDVLKGVLGDTATATDTATNGKRVSCYLRLGQAYQNLRNQTPLVADRKTATDNAAAAFTQAQTLGWGKWNGWNAAAEAMVEAAGNLHWNSSDPQANPKALALVSQVIASYPIDYGSYPRAFGYFRQGEIYRDIGNDLRNQSGKDYLTPLQNAVNSFSRVTASNFPDLDPESWFFINAPQNIGDCYISMKQFNTAEGYFTTSLRDPKLPDSSKVWAQFSLANCYGEEVMQMLQEGNAGDSVLLTNAQAIWNKASAAFDAVATFKNADGTPINQGEPAAHALLNEGHFLQNGANTARWNLGMASDVWTPLYTQAIGLFAQVTKDKFPNLPSDGWEFIDAVIARADCLFKLGIPDGYSQGRAALVSLLADMDSGKISDSQRWGAAKTLVSSYRDEANNLGIHMSDLDRLAFRDARTALEKQYINQAQAMYRDWLAKAPADQDATNNVAWMLTDAAWAYFDLADILGWDGFQSQNGDRGYSSGDWATLGTLDTAIYALRDQITGNASLASANGGESIARLYRILGHWNQAWADRLADNTPWTDREARYATALTNYDLALGNAAADNDDYGSSLSQKVMVKTAYARNASKLEDRKRAFGEALDLNLTLLVNPRVYINQVGQSWIAIAQMYRDLHSSYFADPSQLGGLGLEGMDGPNAWQTSVYLLVNPIVNHTGNWSKLDDGWVLEEAKRLLADAQNAKITVNVW
jgi:tetratricopeptide (TPR) repeat protein